LGLNPYALGMRLFYYIEDMFDKGKYSIKFQQLLDADERKKFDKDNKKGKEFIFKIRENFSDSMFTNTFVDQDFVNLHKLFVAGRRLRQDRMAWQYYIKSRKAEDYRKMIQNTLYHPPHIEIDMGKSVNNTLYLVHHFEEKPLVGEFIANTMLGIEHLWGGPVQLETNEVVSSSSPQKQGLIPGLLAPAKEESEEPKIEWHRVLYTMKERKISRQIIQ